MLSAMKRNSVAPDEVNCSLQKLVQLIKIQPTLVHIFGSFLIDFIC